MSKIFPSKDFPAENTREKYHHSVSCATFRKPTLSYWPALIELSSSVKEANSAVTAVRDGNTAPTDRKRGPYTKLTDRNHCVLLPTVVWLTLLYSSLSPIYSRPTRRCRHMLRHRQVSELESRRSDRTWKCMVRGHENLSGNVANNYLGFVENFPCRKLPAIW